MQARRHTDGMGAAGIGKAGKQNRKGKARQAWLGLYGMG